MQESQFRIRKETALLAGLAFILCFILAFFTAVPMIDIARYGNIVRSFLDGDWAHVFHPRISPLMPLVAGCAAWITGFEPFLALKLASSLFFAFSIFPLCGIFRAIFPWESTRIALLMAVFASVPMRYGAAGLRDSAKGFFFILCVWLLIEIFRNRGSWKRYLLLGGAVSLLALTRTECTVYSACFVLAAILFELTRFRTPWRSAVCILAAFLVMLPWLGYMVYKTGYPVPEIRYIPILKKVLNTAQTETPFLTAPATAMTLEQKQETVRILSRSENLVPEHHNDGIYQHFFADLIAGFYPEFGLLALAGIVLRIRRKKWTPEETILLSALLLHAALLVLQIRISDHVWYMSRRYLLPVVPLEFGWAGWIVIELWNQLKKYAPGLTGRPIATVLICGVAIGLYVHAFQRVIKTYTSRSKSLERIALTRISGHIRSDYKGAAAFPLENVPLSCFRTNRLPLIVAPWPQLGFLSGGQWLQGNDELFRSGARMPDYIVIDRKKSDGSALLKNGYTLNETFQINSSVFELYKR